MIIMLGNSQGVISKERYVTRFKVCTIKGGGVTLTGGHVKCHLIRILKHSEFKTPFYIESMKTEYYSADKILKYRLIIINIVLN